MVCSALWGSEGCGWCVQPYGEVRDVDGVFSLMVK